MKTAKAILACLAAIFATISGLDLTGVLQLLPPDVAKWGVVIPSAAAVIAHFITAIKAQLDLLETQVDKSLP